MLPAPPKFARTALWLFIPAYIVLSLSFGQDANWDLKNYHWYNAYAYLNNRYALDFVPSQVPFFYNPWLDVPFYLLASSVPAMLAVAILTAIQALNAVLLYFFARAVLPALPNNPYGKGVRDNWALVCAVLGCLGGGVLGELGTTFYDNILSFGFFGSILLVCRALKQSDTTPVTTLLLAGALSGAMVGFKLPSAVYVVGMCAAFLPTLRWRGFSWALWFGLGSLIGYAFTYGHWGWFLWHNYQNPFFPYFNDIFQSAFTHTNPNRDETFLPKGLEHLIFPYIFTADPKQAGEVPWQDFRVALWYTLLPLVALAKIFKVETPHDGPARREWIGGTYLLWFGVMAYSAWLVMFAIYRYLVPLEMLMPLFILLIIQRLPTRHTTAFTCIFFIIIALSVQPANWGRVPFGPAFVNVQVPPINNPNKTLLVMTSFEPMSHVLSAFPPQIPVVRIQSYFAHPSEKMGAVEMMKRRIAQHSGPILVLMPPWQLEYVNQDALSWVGLQALPQSCREVKHNLDKPYLLCQTAPTAG